MKEEKEMYTGESVQIKEGLEHVRVRPGMYIGSTGQDGLHHLVYEVLDNSIDESLAGYCKNIKIKILKNNIIEIEDDGRGIPVDIHKQAGISTLEVVMTKLGAGGKFESKAYKVSGGLHGVGVSVVNALSEWCEAYIHRDKNVYFQHYDRGKPKDPVSIVGSTSKTATCIIFKPDYEIFSTLHFNYDILLVRIRELAFLNKGISICIEDQRSDDLSNHKKEEFSFEGGLRSFIEFLNRSKNPIHDEIIFLSGEKNDVIIEIAFQYTDTYQENIFSYVNNIFTRDGGTHVSGFKSIMTRMINDMAKKFLYDKKLKGNNLEGEDVREGLTVIINLRHPNPQFEGQTKRKLANLEVRGLVESILYENLKFFFEDHPEIIKKILDKCLISYMARKVAQAKREAIRKGYLDRSSLPGKLIDCVEKDPSKCELFIVEGESAGGTAKLGRSREIQAILPIWGKMLNVEKTRMDKVITNNKFQPLIATLGSGIGENFNISKLRYHKIIVMADADVDGSHIRTLLLTFLFRYFKPLIEYGYVYIAMPPLYKINFGKNKIYYAYDDKEKDVLLDNHQGEKHVIQRYKGLGEMNPDQLWLTTMNPDNRTIIQISLDDALLAENTFSTLMGEKVEPRREFIERYAKKVKNIDI